MGENASLGATRTVSGYRLNADTSELPRYTKMRRGPIPITGWHAHEGCECADLVATGCLRRLEDNHRGPGTAAMPSPAQASALLTERSTTSRPSHGPTCAFPDRTSSSMGRAPGELARRALDDRRDRLVLAASATPQSPGSARVVRGRWAAGRPRAGRPRWLARSGEAGIEPNGRCSPLHRRRSAVAVRATRAHQRRAAYPTQHGRGAAGRRAGLSLDASFGQIRST